jgi:hypothetical protein
VNHKSSAADARVQQSLITAIVRRRVTARGRH